MKKEIGKKLIVSHTVDVCRVHHHMLLSPFEAKSLPDLQMLVPSNQYPASVSESNASEPGFHVGRVSHHMKVVEPINHLAEHSRIEKTSAASRFSPC